MGAVARAPRPKPVLFTVRLLRRPIPRLPKGSNASLRRTVNKTG